MIKSLFDSILKVIQKHNSIKKIVTKNFVYLIGVWPSLDAHWLEACFETFYVDILVFTALPKNLREPLF